MKYLFTILLLAGCLVSANAQQVLKNIGNSGISVSGKLETDILFPQDYTPSGEVEESSAIRSNTYLDLIVSSKYVDAGGRFEMYEKPLPGYDSEYKGARIPFFYITGRYKNFELTAGNFYEQFGSGMVLRLYEDRPLGVDNSLRGGLLTYRSKPLTVKLLGGQQRYYWDYTDGYVLGADAEVSINELIKGLNKSNTLLQWGVSYVSKFQKNEEIIVPGTFTRLNLPRRVGAIATRVNFQKAGFGVMSEFAVKANDPSDLARNEFIYKRGNALLLSTSYSQKGMGIVLQAKRTDNMSFRSERTANKNMLTINHMPAFTKQHTYALAALYPYATQLDGEWAFQGEFTYKFARGTALGGARGTGLKINYSKVNPIEKKYPAGIAPGQWGVEGYSSSFFGMGGGRYYEDINVEISKVLTRDLSFNFMYMYQVYNKTIMEGYGGNFYSNIFVLDAKYRINNKLTIRGEAQYLTTEQDNGDWIYGLLELSIQPSWMIFVSDMYNSGKTHEHYYSAGVAFTHHAHRLQVSYDRVREGFNCSGGVCRYVPESKGFKISFSTSF